MKPTANDGGSDEKRWVWKLRVYDAKSVAPNLGDVSQSFDRYEI